MPWLLCSRRAVPVLRDQRLTATRHPHSTAIFNPGGRFDKTPPTPNMTGYAYVDQLYANCVDYIHGHSVGGTNPSLLRAMGAGAPVLAYDVEFSHEVTADQALFWKDAPALTVLLEAIAEHGYDAKLNDFAAAGRQRIRDAYQWDQVTDDYEALIHRLDATRRRKARR